MKITFKTKAKLDFQERERIHELGNNEYPKNLAHSSIKDLEDYLEKLSEQSHILMLSENGEIHGWYFDFIREKKR